MNPNHEKSFIYWDNSNIFIGAKYVAEEREGAEAGSRVRVDFKNLFRLAHADRDIVRAVAVGSIPPELAHVWNRMEQQGIEVVLLERGINSNTEQGVDESLQNYMLLDALIHNGSPGIVTLLTGDGKGFHEGKGFHKAVEQMHKRNWRIEVLSWTPSCNKYMLDWVNEHGTFIPLEDFYTSITYLESPAPGMRHAAPRYTEPLDLTLRPTPTN